MERIPRKTFDRNTSSKVALHEKGLNMYFISHRGNISGPRPKLENTLEYIEAALKRGYDVEIDVWYVDDKLYLGHDEPQYEIKIDYLKNKHFWCHCKNVEALKYLLENNVHCFFHDQDDVALTSERHIWTFPKKKLVSNSICVLPERGYDGDIGSCSGICSDYIEDYKNK